MKFVIYNHIGPNFVANPLFSGKEITIDIYSNPGLAWSGFQQLGPEKEIQTKLGGE